MVILPNSMRRSMAQVLFLLFMGGHVQADCLSKAPAKPVYHSNLVYIELFGNAAWASLNYERIISQNEKSFLALRGGILWYKLGKFESLNRTLSLPIELCRIQGTQSHHLEYGAGLTYVYGRHTY